MNKNLNFFFRGIALFVLIWLINVFIAFVIFKPIESHTNYIMLSFLLADVTTITTLYLKKRINYFSLIGFFSMFVVIAILYFIPLSSNIPSDAIVLNNQISYKYEDRYDYAQALFYNLEKRWDSPIRQYMIEPHKVLLIRSFSYFWNTNGYVDSNIQAQIFTKLLIQSNRFSSDEVKVEEHWCTITPHGVVYIKGPIGPIYADLWAVDNFPEYKFGMYAKRPCNHLGGSPIQI